MRAYYFFDGFFITDNYDMYSSGIAFIMVETANMVA